MTFVVVLADTSSNGYTATKVAAWSKGLAAQLFRAAGKPVYRVLELADLKDWDDDLWQATRKQRPLPLRASQTLEESLALESKRAILRSMPVDKAAQQRRRDVREKNRTNRLMYGFLRGNAQITGTPSTSSSLVLSGAPVVSGQLILPLQKPLQKRKRASKKAK